MIKRQSIIFYIVFFLVLFLFFQVAGYFAQNAESFKFVKSFIASNKAVRKELGHIRTQDITLSRIFEGGQGDVELDVSIHGSKQNGEGSIKLQKEHDKWKVINAKIETQDNKQLILRAGGKTFAVEKKEISWTSNLIISVAHLLAGIVLIRYREGIANKLHYLRINAKIVLALGAIELFTGAGFLIYNAVLFMRLEF